MEGAQYLQHRVVNGVYRAVMYWRIQNGIVSIKEPGGWKETTIPVEFVKDFDPNPNERTDVKE